MNRYGERNILLLFCIVGNREIFSGKPLCLSPIPHRLVVTKLKNLQQQDHSLKVFKFLTLSTVYIEHIENVKEYDQDMPQSQTTDQPTTP